MSIIFMIMVILFVGSFAHRSNMLQIDPFPMNHLFDQNILFTNSTHFTVCSLEQQTPKLLINSISMQLLRSNLLATKILIFIIGVDYQNVNLVNHSKRNAAKSYSVIPYYIPYPLLYFPIMSGHKIDHKIEQIYYIMPSTECTKFQQ